MALFISDSEKLDTILSELRDLQQANRDVKRDNRIVLADNHTLREDNRIVLADNHTLREDNRKVLAECRTLREDNERLNHLLQSKVNGTENECLQGNDLNELKETFKVLSSSLNEYKAMYEKKNLELKEALEELERMK